MPRALRPDILLLALVGQTFLSASLFAGEISGKLTPPERVKSVSALDRGAKMTYPATFDPKTGEYRAQNLPAGTYDLLLETTAGKIEGANLKVRDEESKPAPQSLKPSELDREELAKIGLWLAGLYAERSKDREKARPESFIVHMREARVSSAAIVAGGKTLDVPLKEDEPATLADELIGLTVLVRERNKLPPDFDLSAGLAEDAPITVTSVPPELTEKDRAWILDWVARLYTFENKNRVLDMDGNGQHARVLVEAVRDKQEGLTLDVKEPTAFWRVEIYELNKHYGGWSKDKTTVLFREQVPLRVFRTYRWTWDKRLGGIVVSAEGTTTVAPCEVPEKLDPAKGRTPY